MLSIILGSYKRNLRRYIFAIVALALATVVSSLGLSGVELMSNMWRYPFVQWSGGQILVRQHGESEQWLSSYDLFSFSKVHDLIAEIYPEADITATLNVPARVWENPAHTSYYTKLVGRAGGLDKWYLMPPMRRGQPLNEDNLGEAVFLAIDSEAGPLPANIASYGVQGGQEVWQLVGAKEQPLTVIGTTGSPDVWQFWGHLGVAQQLSNTPTDRVNIVGIALPGLQANVDDRVDVLRSRLAVEMPELEAVTVDQFGELVADDLVTLRQAATRYTPILLVIALQVVIATALAVVHSRRRELSLLRVIGFSNRQVWLLFTLECSFSALIACGIGLVAAKITAYIIFQSSAVSLAPFALAMSASILVSMLIGQWAVSSSVPSVLRNS